MTWSASASVCRTSSSSGSRRSGCRRSTSRRWLTAATTWPIPATSTRVSARWPTSTTWSRRPTTLGLRLTVDIVPNHFSDQHPWFQAALAAGPGSPERDRFIFREGRGDSGELPPNNWPSVFGGSAWQRVEDGQWYLHLFAPEQPDLNWSNPQVPAEFARILRFWLDRGVDGFRVDVAHGMAKPPGLPDMDLTGWSGLSNESVPAGDLRWDQDGVHEYLRGFRSVIDEYPGDRMAVGEIWVADDSRLARYVRPDELNLSFNFSLLETNWDAPAFAAAIRSSLAAMADVGAPCTWVLSNHDVVRHVTRYGDGPVGLARGRAAAMMQLSLPGAVYLYNGDELGLPNVDLPDAVRQDPLFRRSGGREVGRDGERVPLPWSGATPPFAFSTAPVPWLPMPREWAALTIAAQSDDADSTLNFYRRALSLRPTLAAARNSRGAKLPRCACPTAEVRSWFCSTVAPSRCRCRRASCCWRPARWSTGSYRPTPRCGCATPAPAARVALTTARPPSAPGPASARSM